MTPYANRWSFKLTSSFNKLVSIEEKHRRLMSAFARYERPWGVKDVTVPEPPEAKETEYVAYLTLTRLLKSPVRYAAVTYIRRSLPNGGERDDFIIFEFNKTKVSPSQYKSLVHDVLPDYVQAFEGDHLALYPQQPFLDYVFEVGRRECYSIATIRGRAIPYIAPVNFWSNSRCIKGFGRTSHQIADLLGQEDIPFSWIGDGIYVVFNDGMIPDEQALEYEYQFRQLFQHKT